MTLHTIDRDVIIDALYAADLDDDLLVESYSGRGMYGDTCFGIAADLPQIARFLFILGRIAGEDDGDPDSPARAEHLEDLAAKIRTDQYGLGTIVYFPGWQLAN